MTVAEQLLAEIEGIIRSMPPRETIRHETPQNLGSLGRASAAMYLMLPPGGQDDLRDITAGPAADQLTAVGKLAYREARVLTLMRGAGR